MKPGQARKMQIRDNTVYDDPSWRPDGNNYQGVSIILVKDVMAQEPFPARKNRYCFLR